LHNKQLEKITQTAQGAQNQVLTHNQNTSG